MRRIGHKGAAALAPENTLRSLERAVEVGVDLVEFDVLALADGTLALAHSEDLREVSHGTADGTLRGRSLAELRRVAPDLPTLDEALQLLGALAPEVGLHVDLKGRGHEREVVEALRRHGAVGRALVSSCLPVSLRRVAELEPGLTRARTYPFDRHALSSRRALGPALRVASACLRALLPARIGRLLDEASASVASLHVSVVSRAVVRRCHERGTPVIAWTVDDERALGRLAGLGVDAVVTNDPRIFAARLPAW